MKRYFLFLLLVVFLTDCKKSKDQIPNAYVDFYIYLSEPSYAVLQSPGNYVYVSGGVKGIIVYRKDFDRFAAYDRSCPYDPNTSGALLEVDSTGLSVVDKLCGSKFSILDGSVVKGPATAPLRGYYADYNASANYVHIHN